MFFFDIEGLIKTHQERPQTPNESLKYLIGFAVVYLAVAWSASFSAKAPSDFGLTTVIWLIAECAISIFCLNVFYESNGGYEGKQFLERLLSVSWVIGLRAAFFFLFGFGIILFLEPAPRLMSFLSVGVPIVVFIYTTIGVKNSLKEISEFLTFEDDLTQEKLN